MGVLLVFVGLWECGDWEDSDPNGGFQDKTEQVTESGKES